MGPVLNALIKLQSIENRLRAVKSKLSRCRRTVIFQENQLRTLQSGLKAKKEEIKMTRVQADRLELELKQRDESIARLRAHLNMAKTNKEYSAILTELNTSKADNSKIESQVLELMKNVEADEAVCIELQSRSRSRKADSRRSAKTPRSKRSITKPTLPKSRWNGMPPQNTSPPRCWKSSTAWPIPMTARPSGSPASRTSGSNSIAAADALWGCPPKPSIA